MSATVEDIIEIGRFTLRIQRSPEDTWINEDDLADFIVDANGEEIAMLLHWFDRILGKKVLH